MKSCQKGATLENRRRYLSTQQSICASSLLSKATVCTQEAHHIDPQESRCCAVVESHTLLTKGVVKVFVARLCCQLLGVTFDTLKHKHTRNRKRLSSKWPPESEATAV